MIVTIKRKRVDVLDHECGKRPCFRFGIALSRDGRGRRTERNVCGTRHSAGCPTNSVCPACRSASIAPPGSPCWRKDDCDGVTVAPERRGEQRP